MTSEPGWKAHRDDGKIEFIEFPTFPYEESLNLQRTLNRKMVDEHQAETVIICEHDPVYTCGIHHEGYPENLSPLFLIERGGGVTYHGPGQITCYFLLDLGKRDMNILDLIEFVHGCEIEYLRKNSVEATSQLGKKTGVWVGEKKIGSTGFSLRSGFTMHGIGLNIQTELEKFSKINPCGFDSSIMTSLSEITGKKYRMETEKKIFIDIVKNQMKEAQ